MKSEYDTQAEDFLKRTGTTLTLTRYPENLAPKANWSPVGHAYKVTLESNARSYSFDFWDSYIHKVDGKRPEAYDVLACLASDTSMEYDNVDDFAEEFGYTKPSEAIRVFDGIKKQIAGVTSLYDLEQREMLWEIR